jgi:surface polysaccharide O-acyltransferase-like enzyme
MEKQYFSKTERLNDVVVIRSLAIVMVVAFHAYYMMLVPAHFPESRAMYHEMYFTFNCITTQFRMPLFIMISGYLFSHLENDRGKYATLWGLIKNKFKRLIIPFYVFATVFMVTINDFSLKPYYTWGYQHLWFITMLFWCFIITRILSFVPYNKTNSFKIVALLSLFLLSLVPRPDFTFLALTNIPPWYFWFYFGYQLYLSRDRVYGMIDNHKVISLSFLILLSLVCLGYKSMILTTDNIRLWYGELGNVSFVILMWYLINKLIFSNLRLGGVMQAFNHLNKYSYGIYVFHNWIQPFMISTTAIALFHLDVWAMNYPVLFPLLFFVSSFIVSLGLSWLLLKTRVGKFLIG